MTFLVTFKDVAAEDPVHRGKAMEQHEFYRRIFPPQPMGDASAELSPNYELLHQQAIHLKMEAKRERWAIEEWNKQGLLDNLNENEPFAIAAKALLRPSLVENTVFVQKWAAWWRNIQRPNPFETRLDAERYLMYVYDRIYSRIPDHPAIVLFEDELISEYSSMQIAAGTFPPHSQDGDEPQDDGKLNDDGKSQENSKSQELVELFQSFRSAVLKSLAISLESALKATSTAPAVTV